MRKRKRGKGSRTLSEKGQWKECIHHLVGESINEASADEILSNDGKKI